MNEGLLQKFVSLIATQTGLQIRPQDQEMVQQKLWVRLRFLRLSTPEDYYQLLENSLTLPGTTEWQALMLLLTIGESYFFRDQGQFHLLRTVILPGLIAQRRSQVTLGKPTLRLWSAGCSTGEEPYSLAILLRELLPDWEAWNLTIAGTDINHEAIARARRGIYTPWSFRSVDPDLQTRYFQPRPPEWELNPSIRQMVSFRVSNLVQDPYPNPLHDLCDVDLILCRNVFIYFSGEAIATVLRKFHQTLRPGGYLLTGHTELQGRPLNAFQPQLFAASVVYQRAEMAPGATTPTQLPHRLAPPPLPLAPPLARHQPALQQAQAHLQAGNYPQTLQLAQEILQQCPDHFDACDLIAQAYGNLGNYDQARHYCQRALDLNAFAVSPYYLLAHIAEAQGDTTTAKTYFKKIIYLLPAAIPAYVELSALYDQEGDYPRGQKLRTTALELLKKLPPDTLLPLCHATANEVIAHLQSYSPASTSPP